MTRLTYSLETGDADADRLRFLNDHYNPSSRALLESAGVSPGDRVIDVGRGHGAMTEWLAQRAGESGRVYAVDRRKRSSTSRASVWRVIRRSS